MIHIFSSKSLETTRGKPLPSKNVIFTTVRMRTLLRMRWEINKMESHRLMTWNDSDTFTMTTFDLVDVNCDWTRELKVKLLSPKSGEVSYDPILGCIRFQHDSHFQLEVIRDDQREAFADEKCYFTIVRMRTLLRVRWKCGV